MTRRIATWNVNDIHKRLPLLLAWLDATSPDVVALQELKCTQAAFPVNELKAVGYDAVWVGQANWNGVALLSRIGEPVLVRAALPGNAADKQARYIEAAVDGVVIASLYLPNGNPWPGPKFDYKMAWFARLLAHARSMQASGYPVVLAGDFNVVPTDDDIYNSSSWNDNALVQAEPRAAYAALLGEGWLDCIRSRHPQERVYTFWDYRRNRWHRDAGLRIDHILLSRPLRKKLKSAGVDRAVRGIEGASDHAPAWIELTWR